MEYFFGVGRYVMSMRYKRGQNYTMYRNCWNDFVYVLI